MSEEARIPNREAHHKGPLFSTLRLGSNAGFSKLQKQKIDNYFAQNFKKFEKLSEKGTHGYHLKLLDKLKTDGVYTEGLLFTGITADIEEEALREFGSDSPDRRKTFAYTEKELTGSALIEKDLFDYADKEGGWILVYDGSKLTKIEPAGLSQYEFTSGVRPIDALIAAYKLLKY